MESRVRVNDSRGVGERRVPIKHLRVAATTIGGADTLYTVRADTALELRHLSVVNTSASAVDLDIHSVPPGDSAATENTEVSGLSVGGDTAVDLTDYLGGFYEAGTTLEVFAGTTNVLVIHGWGIEVL